MKSILTQHMHSNKWAKALVGGLFLFTACVVGTLSLAGYFYLWKIKQPVSFSPLTIFQYWKHYGHHEVVQSDLKMCLMFSAGLIVATIVGIVLAQKKRSLHGDARFANDAEIKAAGLLEDDGVVLGVRESFFGLFRKYLTLPGQLGVLLAAPPRSGKGAGVVQPNALSWKGSFVALDVRRESWRLTSGFRRMHGQEVHLFDPLSEDGKTAQWNPLSYVSDDPVLRINDLQKIANFLSPDPTGDRDPFWPATCRKLFTGLALFVFETPGLPRTFGEVVRQIMIGESESVGDHLKKVIEARDKSGNPLSDQCKQLLFDFIFTSANTQSSIRATFTAKLELWTNPLVDAATSGDSFDLRDLRKKRISIWFGTSPGDLSRLALLTGLFWQQLIDVNTREMPEDNPDLKFKVLLMMDEFTAPGRMDVFAKSVSYLGGYNLIPVIVIQGPSQIRSVYGQDDAETILDCMGAQIVFAPKDNRHAKEISENLGYETVKSKSRSQAAGLPSDFKNMGSTNTSDHRRELLLPQEVKAIGKEKQIIFIENLAPILCNKIRFWKDPVFKRRLVQAVRVKAIKIELPKFTKTSLDAAGDQGGNSIFEKINEPRDLRAEDFTADVTDAEKLSLSSFMGAPDSVILSKEPISDDEMENAVQEFLGKLTN